MTPVRAEAPSPYGQRSDCSRRLRCLSLVTGFDWPGFTCDVACRSYLPLDDFERRAELEGMADLYQAVNRQGRRDAAAGLDDREAELLLDDLAHPSS